LRWKTPKFRWKTHKLRWKVPKSRPWPEVDDAFLDTYRVAYKTLTEQRAAYAGVGRCRLTLSNPR
jgi:hypothetical protein